MRKNLCKFCVKFCVRFREGFVEGFVARVSGTHPGRLSLKRFGVFGCVGLGSNARQFIYDTVQVGQPETQKEKQIKKKNMVTS